MGRIVSIIGVLLAGFLLLSFHQGTSWRGEWTGDNPDGATFTITIKEPHQGVSRCIIHAEGIQTFYTLECRATGNPTRLNVYYRSATDGAFYAQDRVKHNQPLLVLKREKGKVIWQWQQIFDESMVMRKS